MNPGKRFEEKFRKGASAAGYVMRIPDKIYWNGQRVMSEESEADFLVFAESGTWMVECKASSQKRLAFDRVKEHQERSLSEFEWIGKSNHGLLAIEFYGTDYRKDKRMFLLPISRWLEFERAGGRSSMPMSEVERLGVECPHVKGGYLIDLEKLTEASSEDD